MFWRKTSKCLGAWHKEVIRLPRNIRKCTGQESLLTTSSLHEDDWGRVSRFSVSKIFKVFKFVSSSLHWLGKLWYSFPTAIQHLIVLKIKYGLRIIEKHFLKEKAATYKPAKIKLSKFHLKTIHSFCCIIHL